MLFVGDIVKDRYIVTSMIMRGTTGNVFLVEDMKTRTPVVIKTSRNTLVLRETTTLSHEKEIYDVLSGVPGIPKVQEFFLERLHHMFVFPYLGKSMKEICVRRGFLTHADACHMGVMILDVLQGVHERGVLHLDVNPGNILFDGCFHLTDFGSAGFTNASPSTNARFADTIDTDATETEKEANPFSSRHVDEGGEPSKIDDYESLMYSICAVVGELPWLKWDWSLVDGRLRSLKKRYHADVGYGFPDAFKRARKGVIERNTNYEELKQLLVLAISQANMSEE